MKESGGMSHIGSQGSNGSDGRVDGLIENHHKRHKETAASIKETATKIAALQTKIDGFTATLTDHLSNHPAPATQEMPAPQVVNHRQDVHHRYIEKISDEEQARIEQALHTAQRAMEQADYAIGQSVLSSQMYERTLDEKQSQISDLQRDVATNAARHSNDLGLIREQFKQQLNLAYICFGAGLGVALVIGLYNLI